MLKINQIRTIGVDIAPGGATLPIDIFKNTAIVKYIFK
jgi:hypothetical protein